MQDKTIQRALIKIKTEKRGEKRKSGQQIRQPDGWHQRNCPLSPLNYRYNLRWCIINDHIWS